MKLTSILVLLIGLLAINPKVFSMTESTDNNVTPNVVFNPTIDEQWIGLGISYGSYRDGESPSKGNVSSEDDIFEDMQ